MVQLGDSQLFVDRRIVDLPDGRVRCYVLDSRKLPQLGPVRKQYAFPSFSAYADAYWRRVVQRSDIVQFAGTGKIPIQSSWYDKSQIHPLLATLDTIPDKARRTGRLKINLQELVHGKVVQQVTLDESVKLLQYDRPPHQQTAIRLGGEFVSIVVWDEIVVARLPEEFLVQDVPDPLRLLYPRVPVIHIEESLGFSLSARGGIPPLKYKLGSQVEGVIVEEKTGQVTVDYGPAWTAFSTLAAKGKHPYYSSESRVSHIDQMLLCDFFEPCPPAGQMFVELPVQFMVSDQSGQQDRILVTLIGLAPAE